MMENKLIVSSSPHVRTNKDTSYIMKQVVIALLPATLAALFFFRLSALNVIFFCVTGSVGAEFLCQKISKQESTIGDFSAVVTGLLLAFNVPASLPWWMCLLGAAFAIIVVKMVFGGIGNNFVNPALAARAFLLASFPVAMTLWTRTGVNWVSSGNIDAYTTATPLSFLKAGSNGVSSLADSGISISNMLIGNIGVPPLERREEFTKDCVIVCEMSCHQLEYVKASPDVAVLLNVYPEHLDHYTDFAAYRNAKLNIFRYQNENDTLIIGEEVKQYADTKARVITAGFSCGDIGTRNGGIFIGDEFYPAEMIDTKLKGEHNLYNIAIAIYAATKAGCTVKQCLDALPQFNGLEHRLEYVCTLNGAEYINDSISTAPQTAIAALKAYPDTDTLIIGGMDRGIPYDELSDWLSGDTSVRNLIILPDSGKRVAEKVTNPLVKLIYADDMEQAVKYAKQVTKTRCILSPAAASYGFYKNFEERGKHFKELVTSNN